jgi:hypothetical protein
MCKKNPLSGVINQIALPKFVTFFSLMLALAIVLPAPCTAKHGNINEASITVAANEIILATSQGIPPTQGQGLDPEVLEILKTRKSTLDQERAQIENELHGIITVGVQQQDPSAKRTKRAMCKVNQDLQAMNKRIAAHQQKREAFERDWNAYYVSLRDSAEVKSLNERKRVLDWDRTQIEKKLSELVRKDEQQLSDEKEIQWYQVVLREIDQRLIGYQNNRNAFERDWEAFYSNR